MLAEAKKIATEFLDKPSVALQAIKQVLRSSWGKTTADGVDEEADTSPHAVSTPREVGGLFGVCMFKGLPAPSLLEPFRRSVPCKL